MLFKLINYVNFWERIATFDENYDDFILVDMLYAIIGLQRIIVIGIRLMCELIITNSQIV